MGGSHGKDRKDDTKHQGMSKVRVWSKGARLDTKRGSKEKSNGGMLVDLRCAHWKELWVWRLACKERDREGKEQKGWRATGRKERRLVEP